MRRRPIGIALRVAISTIAFAACTTSAARFEDSGSAVGADDVAEGTGGTGGAGSSVGTGGCGDAVGSGGADDAPHPTTVVGVHYWVEWDLAGAEMDASGTGWSTVNDLGYRFAVERAEIVSHDMSLVPCPSDGAGAAGGGSGGEGGTGGGLGLGPLRLRLGPPSAFANHSTEVDPSLYEAKLHEEFARPGALSFGTRDLFATTYCEAHYLVAGQPADPSDPDGVDEASIDIVGTWRQDGDEDAEATPFSVRVTWANGIILPLPAPPDCQHDGGIARITMVRPVGTVFDAVDPSDGLDDEDQRRVFSNLVRGTRVELTF